MATPSLLVTPNGSILSMSPLPLPIALLLLDTRYNTLPFVPLSASVAVTDTMVPPIGMSSGIITGRANVNGLNIGGLSFTSITLTLTVAVPVLVVTSLSIASTVNVTKSSVSLSSILSVVVIIPVIGSTAKLTTPGESLYVMFTLLYTSPSVASTVILS